MRSTRFSISAWGLAFWLALAACLHADQSASLNISPSSPNASWSVILRANEDATASVSVAPTGTANGVSYQLSSGPSATITGSGDILWTGAMSGNGGTFSVCNTGEETANTTASVGCVWSPTTSGGGSGGSGSSPSSPPDVNGLAEAIAELTGGRYIAWDFTPAMQAADGLNTIEYTVWMGDANGEPLKTEFSNITAENLDPTVASWTISQPASEPGGVTMATGDVTTLDGSTGKLKTDYTICGVSKSDTAAETLHFATVRLKEVHFRGFSGASGFALKQHDDPETAIDSPEWLDVNLNGNTADSGDKNEPGAFKKSTTFKVQAVFEVKGVDPDQVKVWADGGVFGGLNSASSSMTLDSAGAAVVQINSPSSTITYKEEGTWQWDWKYNFTGDSDPHDIGNSSHSLCITHDDPLPIGAPTFKWAMITGTQYCEGLSTTPKEAADQMFNEWGSKSVQQQTLHYSLNELGDNSTMKFLLNHKKAACGSWANYFFHALGAVGLNNGFKVRAFQIIDVGVVDTLLGLDPSPGLDFPGEVKWNAFTTARLGVNNTLPAPVQANINVVDPGRYSQTLVGTKWATAAADIKPKNLNVWGFINHAVVMLQDNADCWLYDPSFGNGQPIKLTNFTIPGIGGISQGYVSNDIFRTAYFDAPGNFAHVAGTIWALNGAAGALTLGAVPVPDETLPNANPNSLWFTWWDGVRP